MLPKSWNAQTVSAARPAECRFFVFTEPVVASMGAGRTATIKWLAKWLKEAQMVRKLRLGFGSTVAAMLATAVWAQIQQAGAPVAPVPTQIASAKKVFISNMGTDTISAGVWRQLQLAENKPYNEFYAAVKAWGRYQLVDSPADADLVYEIGFAMPIVSVGGSRRGLI
jgi:hypothetical protein